MSMGEMIARYFSMVIGGIILAAIAAGLALFGIGIIIGRHL